MSQYPVVSLQTMLNRPLPIIEENPMNVYEIAVSIGAIIFCFWILAAILSCICQWCWAWIDDSKFQGNWLYDKMTLISSEHEEFIYPLYEGSYDKSRKRGMCYLSKIKKHKGGVMKELLYEEGVSRSDFIKKIDLKSLETYWLVVIATPCIPMSCLVAFQVYPITLAVFTLSLLAFLARFARRNQKLFKEHVIDKNAHKALDDLTPEQLRAMREDV